MRDQEIELMEVNGVWQVRTPKPWEKPRKRSRSLVWDVGIVLSPILVAALMVFSIIYFGDTFIADAETAGIATLLSCWAVMFVLSAVEGLRGR